MSVITIQTSQGLKQVRIAGEEPTPEELERAREIFEYPQGEQGAQGAQGGGGSQLNKMAAPSRGSDR